MSKSLPYLQEYAIDYIKNEIENEKYLSNKERFIGGKIHYVTMDTTGNIETNIE